MTYDRDDSMTGIRGLNRLERVTSPPAVDAGGPEASLDRIANALATRGYIILPALLPEAVMEGLFRHFESLGDAAFESAGIGRNREFQRNAFIRSDEICWLDSKRGAVAPYFHWIEALRGGLNRRLFLGLFDYECHFACYPPGAFYKRHRDAFQGNNSRVISTVLYLNPEWQPGDGGELVLYDPRGEQVLERILPTYGTMVLFLSEEFPHEVLPAARRRHSLAGWFRLNDSQGNTIDPAR